MSEVRATGWVGWAYFAAVMLFIGAGIDLFYGIMAIIGPNTAYFVGSGGGVASFNVAAWGWWSLIIGVLLLLAGLFLLRGAMWARVFAVIIAGVNAITQLMSLPAQPWWSIVMVAIDVLVIYAVTVHGRELRD
ncbi:hypothetical protein [Leifsonia shinshuensis]|uniref:DUF7144 family membrane protein n=1 Tax=Leifsonia shinshuensis TaxID=150026 RepID=UPI00285D9655|nr:hypothetical protein [Leifsonia shinshuensis]MDR6970098.1 putative membrane metal-binding protein [Leifsonia shinshuensis]